MRIKKGFVNFDIQTALIPTNYTSNVRALRENIHERERNYSKRSKANLAGIECVKSIGLFVIKATRRVILLYITCREMILTLVRLNYPCIVSITTIEVIDETSVLYSTGNYISPWSFYRAFAMAAF